ncbi:MAG: 16S rRNA (adenine(1518)-N(6)/adenine(1519)-N(6))-dimethyltransferase RsmA [Rhodospirillales bacterium]|nr:16S rRNA (adenine(1518)-N(6)/adenine(1519)-N(6))-dimethyltransferase RsmA [Rhodospirillales bacterium]
MPGDVMTDRVDSLPALRDVIAKYELRAKKSLGQNFLLDLNLTHRIARAAGPLNGVDVIEIGPGPGGLTRALLGEGARNVYAVERDTRCIEALQDLIAASEGRLHLMEADAMTVDIETIGEAPRRVVANLPYNIATPLLLKWLRHAETIESLTCMFQREVADRLAAVPGTKAYGRLSVIVQWLCTVRPEFNVPPQAFTPAPKVTSTIVTMTPRKTPLAPAQWKHLETVTAAAFGQRRKMLRVSLKGFGLDLVALGIEPTLRAENLSVETFCRIAEAHREMVEKGAVENGA